MSLYLEHFGLREPPFRITPHTDFFFTGANRGPTLDALVYAITSDEGIVKVTGEVGCGKTMLCRMLMERLPENVETIYLANPSLARDEILGAIADELGVSHAEKSHHALSRALQEALIARYAQGRRVVILIDEAHAMPGDSLEEIRLLSNLESKSAKLLQIALFAQPELDERLADKDMRQLRERITHHFDLSPLTPGDVSAYLDFRLRAAGYRGPTPFSPHAIETIAKLSEGLSRRINILADKALLAAFAKGSHAVDREEMRTAVQDARFKPINPSASPLAVKTYRNVLVGISAILVIGAVAWSYHPIAPPVSLNTEQPPKPNPNKPPPAAAPETTPPNSDNTLPAVAPSHSIGTIASKPAASGFGPLTRHHLTQFDNWLPKTPRSHYFIQLLAADSTQSAEIEDFLARAARLVDPNQIRVYRSSLSGRDRVGIIFGDYPTREEAITAMNALPQSVRSSQPFPRAVSKLL